MNALFAVLLLQQPPGMNPAIIIPNSPDAAIYPWPVTMTVSGRCPQGEVRIVAQLYPTRATRRILELRVGRRHLPRAQLALIDKEIAGALIDTIHIVDCVNPPDDRIRIWIRVERSLGPGRSAKELVTIYLDGDRVSVVPWNRPRVAE
jgi:hypothetical protein